ncbi:putative signal peptide-containing protein [Cryptosporidium canis]|nr:putative signal peptide-containing protein [Cryptosporidium canis]
MKLYVIAFFVFSLINVLCDATFSKVGHSNIDSLFVKERQFSNDNIQTSYSHIVALLKSDKPNIMDQVFLRSQNISEMYIGFMFIFKNDEIEKYIDSFIHVKTLHFLCSDQVTEYIIKNEVKQVKFLIEKCKEKGIEGYVSNLHERKLMKENETEPITGNDVDRSVKTQFPDKSTSNSKLDDFNLSVQDMSDTDLELVQVSKGDNETEKKSSRSCCGRSKIKLMNLGSAIPDNIEDLLEKNNLSELDKFDVSEVVQSMDGTVNFEIKINGKDSIFDEILGALENEDESPLKYLSIEERDLSNAELKEALRETEREINTRKVEIRKLGEEIDQGEHNFLRGLEGSAGDMGSINFQIKNEVHGVPLSKLAESLTQKFIQTEEENFKMYVSSTKKKLFLAIYEFLLVYSAIEENLERIVEIINIKNGIPRLRSFFEKYVDFAAMKHVFKQYFAIYDYAKGKRICIKSDFVRFMTNLSTNKSNQIQVSSIFHFKLEIGFMIMFYSNEELELPKIIIKDEINNVKKKQFYNESVFFNFLLSKHFNIGQKNEILKETQKIISANRNVNPLDRPKMCFQGVEQVLLQRKILTNTQNTERLKAICLQTYGLLGLYSLFIKI